MPDIFCILSTKLSCLLFLFHDLANLFVLSIYAENRQPLMQTVIKESTYVMFDQAECDNPFPSFQFQHAFNFVSKSITCLLIASQLRSIVYFFWHVSISLRSFFPRYGYYHYCFFLCLLWFVVKNRMNTFMCTNKRFLYKQATTNICTETI